MLLAAALLLLLARPRVERRGVADGDDGGSREAHREAVATLTTRVLLPVVVDVVLPAKEAPRRRTKLLPRVIKMKLLVAAAWKQGQGVLMLSMKGSK